MSWKRKLRILISLFALVAVVACNEGGGRRRGPGSSSPSSDGPNDAGADGSYSSRTDGSIGPSITDAIIQNGSVEVRYIIDPIDGKYKMKTTLARNFRGNFYVSAINLPSFLSYFLYVRFRFGRELTVVDVPATVVVGQGISPSTNIQVLKLDMRKRPFMGIQLIYDLFDYNDYDTDDDGVEDDLEPVTNPRNTKLYCRGLDLDYDPTFKPSSSYQTCSSNENNRCLYAYAKIKDAGLYSITVGTQSTSLWVSEPQFDITGSGYSSDSSANAIKKCLPDTGDATQLKGVLNATSVSATYEGNAVVGGTSYTYNGPYRNIDYDNWQISGDAIFTLTTSVSAAPQGIFRSYHPKGVSGINYQAGLISFMFPRGGTSKVKVGTQYYGSDSYFGARTLQTQASSGSSKYLDGCSMRMLNRDPNGYGWDISSCNVSATIEVFAKDPVTGEETTLTSNSRVKLQLIRDSNIDDNGNDVLYSAQKACSSSNVCASDECCYNSRCWSKDIVALCPEDAASNAQNPPGSSCSSDFDCDTYCCDSTSGTCAVHVPDPQAEDRATCSKSPGQTCVAKEWCEKQDVETCYIVKTGTAANGQVQCALHCYNVPTHGDCVEGICVPPTSPTPPVFDENNPDCSNAIDPPTSFP